ncbi:ATP-binding cassette domain-containing protein [Heyndrickxia sp. NPDC080065]|uniref:ATP-binding cassette domain-containing protein n=1 Tax=Heyndrickxia sp. NPDC080065 TaxID=3390568 RepID=UPI003D027AD9
MRILEVNNVSHAYNTKKLFKKNKDTLVLQNLSFSIEEGQCFTLLGSSGAGKSTVGKVILGIEKPMVGQVLFMGHDLYAIKKKTSHRLRRDLQVVFQDSYSSVNSRMTAEQIIAEPLENYEKYSPIEQRRFIIQLLEQVGMTEKDLSKYPAEFSGGQLQRINIARALSLKPKLLVLDEPISSLDMVNQVKILELLKVLKEELHLTYFFITHDIKAACILSDQIAILDKGKIVQQFQDPMHFLNSNDIIARKLQQAVLAEHPKQRTIRSNIQ